MAYIALIFGGFVGVLILSFIIEFVAFKNVEPSNRALYTAGTAYAIASILYGFGSANGGPFSWEGVWVYFPGAALVYLWFLRRYQNAWTDEDDV